MNTWYQDYMAVDGSGHSATYCNGYLHVSILDSPCEKEPKDSLEDKLINAFQIGRVKECNYPSHWDRVR